tara:strand:+ start:426 stop:533 length:108 start_codon:yes stop_codon:yes gene_type:complete
LEIAVLFEVELTVTNAGAGAGAGGTMAAVVALAEA